MRLYTLMLTLILMVAIPGHAQEQSRSVAVAAFDSLYGARVRQVSKTTTKVDDVELAAELLAAAKLSFDQKELLVLICENAYDLGARTPDGYPHATDAMRLLAEHVPEKKTEAMGGVLKLLDKQYKASKTADQRQLNGQLYLDGLLEAAESALNEQDASSAVTHFAKARVVATRIKSEQIDLIKQRQASATAMRKAYQTVKQLSAKLKTNLKDGVSAKRLVEIYVFTLDQPKEARDYIPSLADKDLKTKAMLAGAPVDDLEEGDALLMARWYDAHWLKADSRVKASLLSRSKAYYERFLELHDKSDISRTTAKLNVAKIDSELSKLEKAHGTTPAGAKAAADIKWVNLMDRFAQVISNGTYVRRGAKVKIEEGILQLRGVDQGGAYLPVPIGVENMIFSVKMRKIRGLSVTVGVRVSQQGHYGVGLNTGNTVVLTRWNEVTQMGTELARAQAPEAFSEKGVEIHLAVIKNTIIVFINGKQIIKGENDQVTGAGGVILGGTLADADFADLKYVEPTEEQIEKLLGPQKK